MEIVSDYQRIKAVALTDEKQRDDQRFRIHWIVRDPSLQAALIGLVLSPIVPPHAYDPSTHQPPLFRLELRARMSPADASAFEKALADVGLPITIR